MGKAKTKVRDVRGGLKRFLLIQEENGKPVSTIWEELYEKDFTLFMKLAAQLAPKDTVEMDIPEFARTSEVVPHVVKAIAGGEVSPDDGSSMLSALLSGTKLEKLDELERRVDMLLEQKNGHH